MRDDIDKVLLTEDEIRERVRELGERLSEDYAGCEEDVVLLCILKGAVVFFADLARAMSIPVQMEFMGISSYGNEQKTSGIVRITKDIDTWTAALR
jgi:hypoxanthine phosphoribosyltransferase